MPSTVEPGEARPQPGDFREWGDLQRQIKARDWLTRFTYEWGPLCRWPGATVEQVRERVERDLLRIVKRVG